MFLKVFCVIFFAKIRINVFEGFLRYFFAKTAGNDNLLKVLIEI